MIIIKCQICEKKFRVVPSRKNTAKFCSKICYGKNMEGKTSWNKGLKCPWVGKNGFRKGYTPWNKYKKLPQFSGKNSPNWINGETIREGYKFIYMSNHPFAYHNYCPEHRLVAEKCLGRYLTKKERIHHIGIKYPMNDIRNKSDNRPKNLYLFPSRNLHDSFHHLKNKPQLTSNLIS